MANLSLPVLIFMDLQHNHFRFRGHISQIYDGICNPFHALAFIFIKVSCIKTQPKYPSQHDNLLKNIVSRLHFLFFTIDFYLNDKKHHHIVITPNVYFQCISFYLQKMDILWKGPTFDHSNLFCSWLGMELYMRLIMCSQSGISSFYF